MARHGKLEWITFGAFMLWALSIYQTHCLLEVVRSSNSSSNNSQVNEPLVQVVVTKSTKNGGGAQEPKLSAHDDSSNRTIPFVMRQAEKMRQDEGNKNLGQTQDEKIVRAKTTAHNDPTNKFDQNEKQRRIPNIAQQIQKRQQELRGYMPAVSNTTKWKQVPQVHANNSTRFIVFSSKLAGQGAGNIVSGLMAVHALADEFDRVVCAPDYKDFNAAFRPVDENVVKACASLKLPLKTDKSTLMRLVNYEKAPDECKLQRLLGSDEQVITIIGNTYPRWKPMTDNKYLLKRYTPTRQLQAFLPTKMPKTVVHLRQGDSNGDRRAGLDSKSLAALGKALPSDTYLVTNNLSWYDYFSKHYSWKHPDWHTVRHSASSNIQWAQHGKTTEQDTSKQVQNLQLWSDWFVIASAQLVWHTHSDFSLSAIHWMNVDSKMIKGVGRNGKLILEDAPWRVDEVMLPIKDRGPADIKNCKPNEWELLMTRWKEIPKD